MNWTYLAQDRINGPDRLNVTMILQFHKMLGNLWVAEEVLACQSALSTRS